MASDFAVVTDDASSELTDDWVPSLRFRQHVGFDNLPLGETTKSNTLFYSLQTRHSGYQSTRRSRTFMVGVDEKAYSDYAVLWLLTNMVDDGDEVVCVHVVENAPRQGDNCYKEEAKRLLTSVQDKNELNKAISITLEYSIGRLHETFQKLIQMYQPSLLVVGTKGRSLGGLQGLVTKNSFSKYCLQYSPVPVVVVRPDEKRSKKKEKRLRDPARQSYAAMLVHNKGLHESESSASSVYELEKALPADEEAHYVAAAIGLPAQFDPTIKPLYSSRPTSSRQHSGQSVASAASAASSLRRENSASSAPPSTPPGPLESGQQEGSDEEVSGDEEEEEDEFEVVSGTQLLGRRMLRKKKQEQLQAEEERLKAAEQKEKLHAMEMSEAAALLKSRVADEDEDEDEEDTQLKAAKTTVRS